MLPDPFKLDSKVAIVTGAGKGIGRCCAEILAAAGARVIVSNLHLDEAQEVVDGIRNRGGEAYAVKCNVLDPADLNNLIDFTISTCGTINILVNNAGLGGGGRENPFDIDIEYVERIYRINVFTPLRLSTLAAPYMQKSGYGSIVNITSMSSINREANMAIYSSSKAALNHLSANLAYDFGAMGVRINCVGPGATLTDALKSVLTTQLRDQMLANTPIRRLGTVDDIALAVLFFASPASSWISGQTLFVNGGGTQTIH